MFHCGHEPRRNLIEITIRVPDEVGSLRLQQCDVCYAAYLFALEAALADYRRQTRRYLPEPPTFYAERRRQAIAEQLAGRE